MWPDALIDATCSSRKSQTSSGWANGAMNPPLAPSTCIGMSHPRSALVRTSRSLRPSMGSFWPMKVVPSTAPTAMVFSSMRSATSSTRSTYSSSRIGTLRGSTSK